MTRAIGRYGFDLAAAAGGLGPKGIFLALWTEPLTLTTIPGGHQDVLATDGMSSASRILPFLCQVQINEVRQIVQIQGRRQILVTDGREEGMRWPATNHQMPHDPLDWTAFATEAGRAADGGGCGESAAVGIGVARDACFALSRRCDAAVAHLGDGKYLELAAWHLRWLAVADLAGRLSLILL